MKVKQSEKRGVRWTGGKGLSIDKEKRGRAGLRPEGMERKAPRGEEVERRYFERMRRQKK